jgi:methylmalonyl-CoA/ethylmalonyl-CoA epimerase
MPLSFKGVDHIAIVVLDTEEALRLWRDRIGLKVLFSEKVNNESVLLTHLSMGNVQLQLVQPLTEPHPLRSWLENNGGSGLHHICFEVGDIEASFKTLFEDTGLRPSRALHQGTLGKKALFIERSDTAGVQIELTGNAGV